MIKSRNARNGTCITSESHPAIIVIVDGLSKIKDWVKSIIHSSANEKPVTA